MPYRIDVYYVPAPKDVCTAGVITIYESWDGSLYGESNVKDCCGPDIWVTEQGGVAYANGIRLNCPIGWVK